MRVALPVEPFYKTESEVATMEYVRRHSSTPVPRVVAYASSASNELGFEWILMDKISGLPLEHVWDTMPFEAKVRLAVRLARSLRQLRERSFPLLGNIYFADVWNQVNYAPNPPQPGTQADPDTGADGPFVIGRVVSTRFFRDKRLLLRANRGPFATARELVAAEAELLGRRIRHLSPVPGTDYYCEVDELLHRDGEQVLDVFEELKRVVPLVCPGAEGPEDEEVLWHDDLSLMNVLVDPTAYELAGVVDWESVSVVPAWEIGDGVPHFLRGVEVMEPPAFGSVSDEEEQGLVEIRKDWELVLLRRQYAGVAGPVYDATTASEPAVRLIELSRSLGNFEDRWESTDYYWLEHQLRVGMRAT